MVINGGAPPLRASSPQQPQSGELSRRYVALEEQVSVQPEGGAGEPNNDVPAGEGVPVDLKRLREKLDGKFLLSKLVVGRKLIIYLVMDLPNLAQEFFRTSYFLYRALLYTRMDIIF